MDHQNLYGDSFTFLYVDVHTSQETPVYHHSLYGDSFTFSYVDYVRTSQETHLWTTTAFMGIALLLYV
jgi:hypothetical protein